MRGLWIALDAAEIAFCLAAIIYIFRRWRT